MTSEEVRRIEAFFAVSAQSLTEGGGFFFYRRSPVSPLRLSFPTVSAPLLSYLQKETAIDPSLRVLTAVPLPLAIERKDYTLYRMEAPNVPDAIGEMVRADDHHRAAMIALITAMYSATEGVPLPDVDAEAFAMGDRTDTYLWEKDGKITAMARVAFRGDTYARINTVITHPDHRGRGYAAMLVGRLASLLLAEGLVPTILAAKENAVANRLYSRLGFTPMGDLYEYRFSPEAPSTEVFSAKALPSKALGEKALDSNAAPAKTVKESAITCGCFDRFDRKERNE